ncbi:hypothetical protein P8891_06190 [Bacillus atrophaeus]|uniref:hypothetical protein n=1 Tax=Bacillus atrophaeus TaxID=1452 RepID=UPI00227DE842|nr:hypothetical protein [Bacillus atrophaeus]MCY7948031.1 hypothetical protein [Bacillus atrophaeus]MCY8098024.1 hypothetical protein [Bacillus atrophaeus]MCY9169948.1 hypothetical protein [Bacillus atrophaeus]MEC0740673.1 hypothetical protein [Bacillus atrophaeus]MEC0747063.1 hypothetical protein [Bacillus atrophaeus]
MTEIDLKLYEFVRSLRLQADEYEDMAIHNEKDIPIFCGKMEAYREIAEKIEKEFRDTR